MIYGDEKSVRNLVLKEMYERVVTPMHGIVWSRKMLNKSEGAEKSRIQ